MKSFLLLYNIEQQKETKKERREDEISPFTKVHEVCINKTNKSDMGPGMRKGCVLVFSVVFLAGACLLDAQEIDRFYLNLLEKGESSYLAGNHDDALRQLETSLFGLFPDKKLRAKALIYMSLCSYYIKETARSRDYLSQAFALMEGEGFADVDIVERVRGEISGLAAHFKLGEYTPQESETRIVSKRAPDTLENSSEEERPNSSIQDLEKRIAADPGNVGQYYHLYELYMDDGSTTRARRTLEKLVEANPDEIQGFYLLGLMRFRDRRYKEAERHFREALRPRPDLILANELTEELKTYHILSTYLSGDRQKALDMMAVSVHMYTETRIRSLPLSESDKTTLRDIIREYMKR